MTSRRIIRLDAPDVARALSGVPLFDGLPERDVEQISQSAHILSYTDGDVVEHEDQLGFYVILSGRVRLLRDGREVARLESGRCFGDITPRERTQPPLTVVADGNATCLGILRSAFKPVLVRNPRLALRILEEEGALQAAEEAAVARPE